MEASTIERELEELETRIERLRALYEQYFLGIEKLEPLIPRKEVDRRISVLRREQIRNTALRFKFQMLIQRYNTLQQYWARVTREIENGTFRRDVRRAAQRFGETEALTILAKKRAKKYSALADAQEKQKQQGATVIDEAELCADDLLEEESHPAPPPPAQRAAPPPPPPATRAAPTPPPAPRIMPPVAPGAVVFDTDRRPDEEAPVHIPDVQETAASTGSKEAARPAAAPAPAPGALSSGAKSRVAQLAAEMKAKRVRAADAAPVAESDAQAKPQATGGDASLTLGGLELDFDMGPRSKPSKASIPPPASAKPRSSRRNPSRVARAAKGGAEEATPPPPAALPHASPRPQASRAEASRPARQQAAAPGTSAEGDIPEQRLRQIYAKYVETKRAANESTAGVTYEKLAERLRAQTTKLRASYPTKSIDYEVVMKDGKAHLKPIVR